MRTLPLAIALVLGWGLTCVPSRALCQDATREELNHDFIFDLPGISKQDIFDRTERWITNNLRSPGAVIQSEDAGVGSIIANGVSTMTADGDSQAVSISFRLSVDVREGKERVRFLSLQTSRGPDQGWEPLPAEGAWHRGAQKRFLVMARILNEYVKMKGEP